MGQTASQRSSSQNSPLCCTPGCLFTNGFFQFWLIAACLSILTQNDLAILTGWFRGPSKRTNWIKKKQFHGFDYFWVPSERWKETGPWKRKFRFSVKVNIYLKPCMHPKSKNVNIENKGGASKHFWNFEIPFQNGKMDVEWTDLPQRNIPPPHRTTLPPL